MIQLTLCGLLLIWLFFAVRNWIWKRELVKLFDYGSVLVFGMRGRGKDTLFNYVINVRKHKYISNVKYTKSAYYNVHYNFPNAEIYLGTTAKSDTVYSDTDNLDSGNMPEHQRYNNLYHPPEDTHKE